MFVALTAILGSIVSGRYELAIMLPEEDEDAINVAALGLLIAMVFSISLMIPTIFLNGYITNLLGNQEISFWLYFVPFIVLMSGLYNVLKYLNIRKKLYKDIASATIYRSTVSASIQLGVGYVKSGVTGLISG
ncbi:MAG: oligosaccharide flippase family protein, partial [Bacteroidales bacterium]|nr:oligosaccharide flippase family protein [Bacteroidales bacterium]